jgi:hypothetical protein
MGVARIGADFAEDFDAVELGELHIEEDDDGRFLFAFGMSAAEEKVIERLGAVVNDIDLVGEMIFGERFEGHLDVVLAVFDEQHPL